MFLWVGIAIKVVVYATVLLELYLLWLILRKTPEKMASFRFSLLMLMQNELCFTVTLGILLDPEILFPLSGSVVNGLVRFVGPGSGRYAFAMTIFFGADVFMNQIYCLLFRYTAIQQRFDGLNKKFNRWPYRLVCITICYFVSVVCGYCAFGVMADPQETLAIVKSAKLTMPEDVVAYLNNTDSTFLIMTNNLNAQILCAVVVLGGFMIVSVLSFGFSISIFRTIHANAVHFTAQTYKLHRQLTLLLIIQFSTPLIFLALPVCWNIIVVYFEISESKLLGDLQVLFLCLYTLVNSAVTLVFVSPYRNFTLRWLECIFFRCSQANNNSRSSTEVIPAQNLMTTKVTVMKRNDCDK